MAFSTSGESDAVLSEINITPLVDVMLVLLVAFIITAPLLNNAVHVNLPKTAITAPPTDKKAVTLSIDAQKKLFIDKREIAPEALEPELKKLLSDNPQLALSLQADDVVSYGIVAKTMAVIERVGVSKLSVLTSPGG
jgi:biopolymer transport protein ExbD